MIWFGYPMASAEGVGLGGLGVTKLLIIACTHSRIHTHRLPSCIPPLYHHHPHPLSALLVGFVFKGISVQPNPFLFSCPSGSLISLPPSVRVRNCDVRPVSYFCKVFAFFSKTFTKERYFGEIILYHHNNLFSDATHAFCPDVQGRFRS